MEGLEFEGKRGDEMDEGGVAEGRSGEWNLKANAMDLNSSAAVRSEVSIVLRLSWLLVLFLLPVDIFPFRFPPNLRKKSCPSMDLFVGVGVMIDSVGLVY